jgi:hypothetical protein
LRKSECLRQLPGGTLSNGSKTDPQVNPLQGPYNGADEPEEEYTDVVSENYWLGLKASPTAQSLPSTADHATDHQIQLQVTPN